MVSHAKFKEFVKDFNEPLQSTADHCLDEGKKEIYDIFL